MATHMFPGRRVEQDGIRGTIRYVGPIGGERETWLGVEWEDAKKGEHDGTHLGQKYFATEHPTAATFVQTNDIDLGKSFSEAFQEKYSNLDDQQYRHDLTIDGVKVEFTFSGQGNRRGKHPTVVSLSGMSVYGQLTLCPHILPRIQQVQELDVSSNLLGSWQDVADMAKLLPNLRKLDVSDNVLSDLVDTRILKRYFRVVDTLSVVRLGYSWEKILTTIEMFPRLQNLHACFNNITSIHRVTTELQQLTLINIEGNQVGSWKEILKLGQLENLTKLIINNTGIDRIFFDDVKHTGKTSYFQSLGFLHCQHNKINEFYSINELNKLQSLTYLILKGNPIHDFDDNQSKVEPRSEVIARIERLEVLNRTPVTPVERRDAEINHLKHHGLAWREAGGNPTPSASQPSRQFVRAHPRYEQLVAKHGAVPEEELPQPHHDSTSETFINLQVTLAHEPTGGVTLEKVPVSMKVQKLKSTARKLLNVDPVDSIERVTYLSPKMPDHPVEMEKNNKEIGFYSIEDGDKVLVYLKEFRKIAECVKSADKPVSETEEVVKRGEEQEGQEPVFIRHSMEELLEIGNHNQHNANNFLSVDDTMRNLDEASASSVRIANKIGVIAHSGSVPRRHQLQEHYCCCRGHRRQN